MTEFHVASKGNSLSRAHLCNRIVDSVGDRSSGQHTTGYHLVNRLQADLLIGDGHEHRNWLRKENPRKRA